MAITDYQKNQINKSDAACQRSSLGTIIQDLQTFESGSGTMYEQNSNDVNITGGSINGVVFGTSTDNSSFESEGTYVMTGSATVWDDLRFPASTINPLGSPAPMSYDNNNLGFLAVHTGTHDIGVIAQMPHGWELGSSIEPHLHWQPTTTDSGSAFWRMSYKWINEGEVDPVSFTDIDILAFAEGTAYKHQISSFGLISGSGKGLSSILSIIISRIGGDASDTYEATALIKEFDIHIMYDTIGSRERYTK